MPAGTATPWVLENPRIYIASVDWQMSAARAALRPVGIEADISTFANPAGKREGATGWEIELMLKQTYHATDGTWNVISALAKTLVTVELAPEDAAATAANPIATCTFWMPSIPFMDGNIGQSTEFTISENLVGDPVFATS